MNKSAGFGENKLEDCKKYNQKVYTTEIMPTQKASIRRIPQLLI